MKYGLLALAMLLSLGLTACNTAQGLGKDIENLGLLIQGKKAEQASAEMAETSAKEAPQSEIISEQYVDQYGNPIQPPQQTSGTQAYPYQTAPADETQNQIAPAPAVPEATPAKQ